ncbi:MAG: alpha/beta fold hydrolase [Dehalococcoidia bacterium]
MTAYHLAARLNVNRNVIRLAALAGLLGLIGVFSMTASAQSTTASQTATKPTIVLVHGAWDNSSGWNGVIERLHAEGYQAIALPNPLRSVTSDAAYIASTLAGIPGPIVLVGHSYGGAVITNAAAGNANVKALVYVAAMIPDVGENQFTLLGQFPGSQINPDTSFDVREYPLPDGTMGQDTYLKPEVVQQAFAQDLPASTVALMAATQRPLAVATFFEPSAAAAWQTIPAYCVVATEDNTIGTANVRAMAQRACPADNIVEVDASHVVMISQPQAVTEVIIQAAGVTAQ